MTARDVAETVGAAQHGEPEGQRDAEEPDAEARERRGEDRASATTEHEDERSDQLGDQLAHRDIVGGDDAFAKAKRRTEHERVFAAKKRRCVAGAGAAGS